MPEQLTSSTPASASPTRSGRRSPVLTIGLLIAIALPAVAAYLILYRQAFLLPFEDDYHAILDFAIGYQQSLHWLSKILQIIGFQHNEYKLTFEHLIVALDLELTGRLNFGFLIAIGNLFLLPIACILWRIHVFEEGRSKSLLAEFLPISLLFFSLAYWGNLDWAMTGLQNIPVVFFVLLSIMLLFPSAPKRAITSRFIGSCISTVLAVFSSANGFLLAPIGLLILLRRRAFTASAIWSASFLVALPIYLYHYMPVHRQGPTNCARAVYSFAFLGCALPNRVAAFILGLVLAIVFALSIRSRFDRTHPVSFYFTVWICSTAVLVAWVRGFVVSRYSIYSVFVLIFAYKFLPRYLLGRFHGLRFKHVFVPSLALSLVFCFSTDTIAFRHLEERRRFVLDAMNAYLSDPASRSPLGDPVAKRWGVKGEEEYERITLTRAIQSHLIPRPTPQAIP